MIAIHCNDSWSMMIVLSYYHDSWSMMIVLSYYHDSGRHVIEYITAVYKAYFMQTLRAIVNILT